LFCDKIDNIVGTVKDKLQEDAKKDGLVVEVPKSPAPVEQVPSTAGKSKKG